MWETLDATYLMKTVTRLPITVTHAKGNYLFDQEENRYLDLFTGLGVNILGHSHPHITKALHEQGERFLHISNLFYNPPAIRLAKRLVEATLDKGKVYFCNSGAEATEAAMKLIHKWNSQRKGIVCLKNGFHGRTLGALRVTRQPAVYQDYPVLDFPINEIEPNHLEQLKEITQTHQPAAVLLEPILGAGGVINLEEHFLTAAQEICQQEGMLFCVDEIQTGIGRTGKLFAYQHYSLTPDLILFAKGVGGGLPLGGVIAGEKVADVFQPGDHGTTFAPSPLSAALGNATLDVLIDQGQLNKGAEAARYLWHKLKQLQAQYPDHIHSIHGKGMMIGIHTSYSSEQAKEIQRNLLRDGILVNITAQNVIRLLPPLTLTEEEMNHFVQRLAHQLQRAEDVKGG